MSKDIPFSSKAQSIFHTEPEDTAKTSIVVGKSKSGKTHFLTDELNKLVNKTRTVDGVIRPMYDKIVIFTESLNSEPFQRLDKNLPIIFVKGYIPKLVLLLKMINDETHNKFKWLVVLDDCVGSASGKSLRGGVFVKQLLTMRNSNLSTIVAVQGSTLLEPKTRESAHSIMVTGLKIKDQVRLCNDLFYDSIMETFPDLEGMRVPKEKVAKMFFDKIGSNVLIYDNLSHKSYLYERKPFEAK